MRLFLLGIVGLGLVASQADARCMAGSIALLPEGGALPANGRIVLTGEGRSAERVAKLEQAWLVGGSDRVRVRAQEHLHGASEQVLLAPERPLKVGQQYRLSVGQASADDRYTLEHTAWTAVAADETAPTWNAPPTVESVRREQMGCGDAEQVRVHAALTDGDGAQLLVRASIEGAGTTTTFWAPVREGVVALGHGMCGGEWVPREGERYTITLTALDAAGHATAAPAPLAVDVRFGGLDAGLDPEPDAGVADVAIAAPTEAPAAESVRAASCSTGAPGYSSTDGASLAALVMLVVTGAAHLRRRVLPL